MTNVLIACLTANESSTNLKWRQSPFDVATNPTSESASSAIWKTQNCQNRKSGASKFSTNTQAWKVRSRTSSNTSSRTSEAFPRTSSSRTTRWQKCTTLTRTTLRRFKYFSRRRPFFNTSDNQGGCRVICSTFICSNQNIIKMFESREM